MQAVSTNLVAARLMAIDVNRIISFTFGTGSVIAAIGGVSYGPSNIFNFLLMLVMIYRQQGLMEKLEFSWDMLGEWKTLPGINLFSKGKNKPVRGR